MADSHASSSAHSPPSIDLTQRRTFEVWTPVTIRWCDTDKLGHVNNVSIASYVEAGRCDFFYRLIGKLGMTDIDFVLARVAIDYRRELHYPGTIEVGSRLIRLGNKSVATGYGCFLGDQCFATAESTNVFIELPSHKTITPPPALRAALENELARQ